MGKPWENGDLYGKSAFLRGKSTISKWQFPSSLRNKLPEGTILSSKDGHGKIHHF